MDKPILYNPDMINAIKSRGKCQTRRILKATPNSTLDLPYQKHDMLWVREAWSVDYVLDAVKPSLITCREPVYYHADEQLNASKPINVGKKRPSIFMPRWASRITTVVVDVRFEALQHITADDAIREGFNTLDPLSSFREAWDKIYAAQGDGWRANPLVSVTTFVTFEENIDQLKERLFS